MKKTKHTEEQDIAQEHYKGPSKASAAAGEGFIAHIKWAFTGLLVGTIAGAALYTPLKPQVAKLRDFANKLRINEEKTAMGTLTRGTGKFISSVFGTGIQESFIKSEHAAMDPLHKLEIRTMLHDQHSRQHGFGNWFFNHTFGLIPGLKERSQAILKERGDFALTFGGIFAFVGYVIVPLALAPFGWKRGGAGKKQFERARNEIWDLRSENNQLTADNESLRERNAELNTKLIEADTGSNLRISRDDTPVMRDQPGTTVPTESADVAADSPTSITPPPITEPKIQEPVIGPAPTTGRVLGEAKGQREWSETIRDQQANAKSKEAEIA